MTDHLQPPKQTHAEQQKDLSSHLVRFPSAQSPQSIGDSDESESETDADDQDTDEQAPRRSGHRFYSNVSEHHALLPFNDPSQAHPPNLEKGDALTGLSISPLNWLGGMRTLKVQGAFPVPQPDESCGLTKPDWTFALKDWIGDDGVETLVYSFEG